MVNRELFLRSHLPSFRLLTSSIIFMKYLAPIICCFFISTTFAQPGQSQKNIRGYWLQKGYGIYLEITDSVYKFYDITKVSCQPSASPVLNHWSGSLASLLDLYHIQKVSDQELVLKYGITSYRFTRLKQAMAMCQKPVKFSNDPMLNFDILWHTFKENYAYSHLRKVNWDKIYKKYRPLVSKKTTPLQLYGYFREILDAIKDAHISLQVPGDLRARYKKSKTQPAKKRVHYQYNYPTARYLAQQHVPKLFPKSTFKRFHKDLLIWGKLNKQVGYLQVNAMNGFSLQVKVADTLSPSKYWDKHWGTIGANVQRGKTIGQYFRDEIQGVNVMIDSVMQELASTTSLILDLRFNNGGTDQVALDILSRFVQKKTKVFSKKVWHENNYSSVQAIMLSPTKKIYKGKIVVLTSYQTASSAETLVLSSLAMPQVIRIGSPTMGVFSDVLQKKLPNGWRFGLSNEIYQSNTQQNFEHQGISPDHAIAYPRNPMAFFRFVREQKNGDLAIQKALSVLSK